MSPPKIAAAAKSPPAGRCAYELPFTVDPATVGRCGRSAEWLIVDGTEAGRWLCESHVIEVLRGDE